MRRFFYVFGIVCTVVVLLVAGLIGFAAYKGVTVDKDALQYADNSVVSITSKWDVGELRKRATADLIKKVKAEDLDSMFTWFATLGPLIQYDGSKQVNWRSFTGIGSGTVVIVDFSGVGRYKNGNATINIEIKKQDGQWQVNGLRVDSSKLIENKIGRGT